MVWQGNGGIKEMKTDEAKNVMVDFVDKYTKNMNKKEYVKIAVALSVLYLKADHYDELREDLKDMIEYEDEIGMDDIEEMTKKEFEK